MVRKREAAGKDMLQSDATWHGGSIRFRNETVGGFTLIELSIVLVIIGLIVGGVLVGQDLIRAAYVRAQITQIEKYNTAVNTFYGKYQALPGDMNISTATAFQFTIGTGCNGSYGQRNGDGQIEGGTSSISDLGQMSYETGLFWQDLSSSVAGNLIEGQFTGGGAGIGCALVSDVPGTAIGEYIPAAKIGANNYVYVYTADGFNWLGLSAVTSYNVTAR